MTDLAAWLTPILDADRADAEEDRETPGMSRSEADFRLATIGVYRRILEMHQPGPVESGMAATCSTCVRVVDGSVEDEPWPCATVRQVASIYADRPGYQEAWRPDCDNG